MDGKRSFRAIAVSGGKGASESRCPPCGVCRQVMREFCDPRVFKVIVAKTADDYRVFTLDGLLPESFGPEHLV